MNFIAKRDIASGEVVEVDVDLEATPTVAPESEVEDAEVKASDLEEEVV